MKGPNQKQKMLYLLKIFSEETDEDHKLNLREIVKKLNDYGVTADRKTLYMDFEELRKFGFDIIGARQSRDFFYFLGSREFELPELKLLVDSVQAARFITDKKSGELIRKLEKLTSRYQAQQLQRQVTLTGRVKAINENIYYSVDRIHEAINTDSKISFRYFQWNVYKEQELRRDGEDYVISPWNLMWDDENYYMIGYDSEEEKIKHYRVDKMLDVELLDERRDGAAAFENLDMAQYSRKLFGMFGGEDKTVTLEGTNDMAAVLIDRFGTDIPMAPTDDQHFRAMVDVTVSRQFLGWIMALGGDIKITGPEEVVNMMKDETNRLADTYLR